jgi:hypothetical protein
MVSNSAELELLFVTLRQQAAPVPVVVTLSKTNTEKRYSVEQNAEFLVFKHVIPCVNNGL